MHAGRLVSYAVLFERTQIAFQPPSRVFVPRHAAEKVDDAAAVFFYKMVSQRFDSGSVVAHDNGHISRAVIDRYHSALEFAAHYLLGKLSCLFVIKSIRHYDNSIEHIKIYKIKNILSAAAHIFARLSFYRI